MYGSGTINSSIELQMFSTNLVRSSVPSISLIVHIFVQLFQIKESVDVIDMITNIVKEIPDDVDWDFEATFEWFYTTWSRCKVNANGKAG